MKINVCSETALLHIKGDGVCTAFIECVQLLKEDKDTQVLINSEGMGDVMHCHTYGPYFFWRGMKYKGRRIFTAHVIPDSIKGSLPASRLLMPVIKWYLKKVFSYADVCIAISPMVEKAIKDLGVKTKIVRLYNPLPVERWKRTEELRAKGRKILGLKEDDFCVLGVGQLESRKGCKDFIEVAGKIPEAQFRWIGGRPLGGLTEGIRSLNKAIAHATPNVKFEGMFDLEEMAALYAAGDAFLFTSYQENCPMAPIEAAASGMPVLFRNLKEYEMLYESRYLKAGSNEEFAVMLKILIKNKAEYKKGLEISERLILQFDKNKIRTILLDIYKTLKEKQNLKDKLSLPIYCPELFSF